MSRLSAPWRALRPRPRRAKGVARRPNFFIVGAAKSGTTALYGYLGQHPEIFVSTVKEPHFFSTDLHFAHRPPWSLDEYLSFFEGAGREAKRIGEASTSYLSSTVAARRIHEFEPAAGVIIMLRNPVDRMYARHSQNLFSGSEDIEDFAAALEAEEDRRKGDHLPPRARLVKALFYRDDARYATQVARYLDTFGRDQVHVILFEDFRRDPARTYASVLEFLDVGPDFQPTFTVANANKEARNRVVHRLLQNPPAAVRRLARLLLAPLTRKRAKASLRHLNTVVRPRPPMDAALRERLLAELRPDIERLAELIQRDLSHWLASEGSSPAGRGS